MPAPKHRSRDAVSGKRRRFRSDIKAGSNPNKRLPSPRTSIASTFSKSPRLVAARVGLGVISMFRPSVGKLIVSTARLCHQEGGQ